MIKNNKNRTQFTFYLSFFEAIKNLEDKSQQADFYNAICEYSLNGNEPNFSGMLKMAWELVKPNLESGRKKAINRLGKKQTETNEQQKLTNKNKQEQKLTNEQEEKEEEKEIEKEIGKEKEIEKEIYKEKNIKKEKTKFQKPTIQEVQEYCKERDNKLDAESFVAFYESKGWKVGNQPMKDWKSAVITWEKKEKIKNLPVKFRHEETEESEEKFYL